ncbi:MAG TPA: Asp-tRNA(Asn)/Glu-tRNA(Gln) amidotransferase subunit GatC [Kiritimatiellia bacterium]|jgi:aspartyl-tRNA(Asn)/glutamyl-tRNA(Gln) amidotransferase subunit C
MSAFKQGAEGIDVAYVAHLARLQLTDAETKKLQGQLDHILAYVDELKKVDVEGVEPMSHVLDIHTVLREDAVKPSLDRDLVLANAPEHHGKHFIVPKIIE